MFEIVRRCVRAIRWLSFGLFLRRETAFAKYRIDSERPARYIERELRRKLRKSIRLE